MRMNMFSFNILSLDGVHYSVLSIINIFICTFYAAKLVPLAYGINKLQISCVVEDEKVSVDELQEKLQEIEDYVSIIRVFQSIWFIYLR